MAKVDMFLKVEGAKSGAIKGETSDSDRKDEIDVVGWSWGMRAHTDLAGGAATGKASMRELSVRKKVDCASTALMGALRNNEPIKSAVLTIRKAGSKPIDYVKITLENGHVTSIDVESGDDAAPEPVERITLSFQKIQVEYVPQGEDGQPRGSMLFEAETPNQ